MSNSTPSFVHDFPVMEHFYTIQGEGFNTGKPAYFIRIAGCDIGCPWCDVKESWEQSGHETLSVSKMIEFVQEAGATNVVITGGEPCMYDLSFLTSKFRENNIQLWLETSGAYKISGKWDWIVVSPKRRKEVLPESMEICNEIKVVIVRRPDLDWADTLIDAVGAEMKCYLQPEWSREEEVMPSIINHVKENTGWQISLQTHKYMRIP